MVKRLLSPSWWMTALVLAVATAGEMGTALVTPIKVAIALGAAAVAISYNHEHHATIRNADRLAAAMQTPVASAMEATSPRSIP